jgi:Pyruvate/2-oxoacid:ferredoxin oxidoreductase delta subunit
MEGESDVYRRLQQHIDRMPVGFPATESGVELRLLKHLFDPEEAELALALSALPEPLERIHKRVKHTGISEADLEKRLDHLVQKGAILGKPLIAADKKGKHYSKAQLLIGMYEFQVDRLTTDYAKDFLQYKDEALGDELTSHKTRQMRTIPINQSIKPEHHVAMYDDIRELVKNSDGPFAVLNCVCRQTKDEVGEPCKLTDIRDTCITFENMAKVVIGGGVGRKITREETLELFDRAEREGMVLQPENNKKPMFVCCCCGCCCGVLAVAKKLERPVTFFHTNYFAQVEQESCTGCETCVDRCPMEAVSVSGGIAEVDLDRCIGCGLCTATCKAEAITLHKKTKPTVPPKDHDALYKKIMMQKLGPWGAFQVMGKSLLGKNI